MDLGLRDKVTLVAASSQGLGKAVALGFAREGARVVINGRHQETLQATKKEIEQSTGAEVLAVQADLTQADEIKKLVQTTVEQFKTVHVLVNNAGGPPPGFFEELDDTAWQSAFHLTLMSSVRLTREVLPFMKKQNWGRIINITSVSVKQPINDLLLSNSLRLGVVGWSKTVASQVANKGILINNVCPGFTRTDRVRSLLEARARAENTTPEAIEKRITETIPMGRMGEPEELANLVVFLGSERSSYITGTTIQVDGGAVKGIF